ncbi:uncharacterized protein B0H18DRAFT_1109391, partial [Fomitopsis serialis]|uniref:uncharacterized protein n=1 Tax=Fomitopsis serialis TaxID=139415 RepID=UPI0020086A30
RLLRRPLLAATPASSAAHDDPAAPHPRPLAVHAAAAAQPAAGSPSARALCLARQAAGAVPARGRPHLLLSLLRLSQPQAPHEHPRPICPPRPSLRVPRRSAGPHRLHAIQPRYAPASLRALPVQRRLPRPRQHRTTHPASLAHPPRPQQAQGAHHPPAAEARPQLRTDCPPPPAARSVRPGTRLPGRTASQAPLLALPQGRWAADGLPRVQETCISRRHDQGHGISLRHHGCLRRSVLSASVCTELLCVRSCLGRPPIYL